MLNNGLWFWIIIIIGFNTIHCSEWLWQCEDGKCVRVNDQSEREGYSSLKLCQLICSTYLNIWPQPTGSIRSSRDLVNINTKSIEFNYNGPSHTLSYLMEITKYFEKNLKKLEPFSCDENLYKLKITLTPMSNDVTLDLDTKESYSLTQNSSENDLNININAPTVFGIRHGLETLFQILISHSEDGSKCLSTLNDVQINDFPRYRHRGLLIDTARNFLTIDTIKRQIEGMASSKLNVLHWHMTDSQSFPFYSSRLPLMIKYGAYSSTKVYTPENIKELIQFAEFRGVRIIIEIDGPSHAGMGWQWGPEAGLGDLAVCINKQPWRSFCIQPPCGQLNPVNPNLYSTLNKLYLDIADLFESSKMFHMGGDEVFIPCWNSTPEILNYLKDKPLTEDKTFLDLWAEFQKKNLNAYDSAVGHNKTSIIVWTSHLTAPEVIQGYLPNDRYIIQTWVPEDQNDLITDLVKLGYKLIVSTKDRWYLDHGFWGVTKYYQWTTVYENPIFEKSSSNILGGEVCMWGELVDDTNIDSRVWPRAAAAAERLWSNPSTDANYARSRFFAHRTRLVEKGIGAEAVIPQWCADNEGECST